MHEVQLSNGTTRMEVLDEIQPLQVSSLLNLLNVPTFGSTPAVQWCIKFLMSRVHWGKLWLDQPYPFTLDHVRDLTGISMDGAEVETAFQQYKTTKKSGDEDLYTKHGTHRGYKGADIASIRSRPVRMATRILTCRVMRKQKKGECNLDILSAAEACAEGRCLNWCFSFMNEFLKAINEAYTKNSPFNYGSFCIAFVMFNWEPPKGRKLLKQKKTFT